jgi:large subunit ribosomal protein L24
MSSIPRKARKNLFNAPNHVLSGMVKAGLSEDLRSKHGINSLRLRKGDTVKIVRGEYSGIEGKVSKVLLGEGRINVEGVTREKIAGGTKPIKIHPSKVVITNLNLDDKWRKKKIEEGQ